jgi:hypothetical protein
MFYLKAEAHANSCCIRNLSPLRHRLVVSRGTKGPWRQWRRNVWPAGAHHVDTGHRAHDHEGRSLNSWATDTDLCTALLSSSPSKLCSRLTFFFALMFSFLANTTYTQVGTRQHGPPSVLIVRLPLFLFSGPSWYVLLVVPKTRPGRKFSCKKFGLTSNFRQLKLSYYSSHRTEIKIILRTK